MYYVVALLIATDILSKLSVIIRHKTHWSVITDWWWCQMRKWMEGAWLLFLLFYALHSTPPSYLESQWWKIMKKVASFLSFLFHNVWKLLEMSHLIIFHFGNSHQFCPIKNYLSGNSVWPPPDHFWHFCLTFINVMSLASLAILNETFSVIFKHCGGWRGRRRGRVATCELEGKF